MSVDDWIGFVKLDEDVESWAGVESTPVGKALDEDDDVDDTGGGAEPEVPRENLSFLGSRCSASGSPSAFLFCPVCGRTGVFCKTSQNVLRMRKRGKIPTGPQVIRVNVRDEKGA